MVSSDDSTASRTTPQRTTPLHGRHLGLGARMADFAGWDMPIDYGSVVAEHLAVRDHAGVFDLTHLGTVRVQGPDAEAVIQASFSNDVTLLEPGTSQYTLCLDGRAGIIDDLLVYRLPDWHLVVPNAANAHLVTGRLLDQAKERDAEVAVLPLACVAVQGPASIEVLSKVVAQVIPDAPDPGTLAYLECVDLPGGDHQVLSRSGYTGEKGFEVFCDGDVAGELWDALLDAGARPAGLGCRDTLRLEMGYPLHGNDITTETTPVEARLGWAVKPGTGFVGEEAYVAAREAGPSRVLRGLVAEGRRAARAGDAVMADGREVGRITSGSFSPVREVAIALALLDPAIAVGQAVEVDVRGRGMAAEVVQPPFVEARTR